MVVIRDEQGRYRMKEVNGRITPSKPILVATRCFAISPFPADGGRVIYFGGHDQSYKPPPNMAWISSTQLDDFLRPHSVDSTDAIIALKTLAGMDTSELIESAYSISSTEFDGNGKIGMADAIYILQVVAGLR